MRIRYLTGNEDELNGTSEALGDNARPSGKDSVTGLIDASTISAAKRTVSHLDVVVEKTGERNGEFVGLPVLEDLSGDSDLPSAGELPAYATAGRLLCRFAVAIRNAGTRPTSTSS